MDLIVSHINADFDALASMVAAKRLYGGAELLFPGSQEKKVREFIASFHPVETMRLKDLDFTKVKRLVVVDTQSPSRIGKVASLLEDPSVTVHLYDHHPHREGNINGKLEIIEKVGATATIFAEIFQEKGIKPSPMEATLMSLAIYEETGNLTFPSTTERDLRAAAFLLKHGSSLKILSTFMKAGLNREELELLNELLEESEDVIASGMRVKIASATREEYVGDAAHLAHRIMDMEDVDALILLLRMKGKIVMIGRSRANEIDVAEVLDRFGGGGHAMAASATITEMSLEVLREELAKEIKRCAKPTKTALDLMTRPIISIEAGKSLKDAEAMMTRFGVNVLPVTRDGEYKGIISRETVEKAIFHGFRESSAMDFASTDAITATPETPQSVIEAEMVQMNQRFMPVLEEKVVVGAITRTDILRVMYEDFLRKRRVQEPLGHRTLSQVRKNLASAMREKFPNEIYHIVKLAGETALKMDMQAFLVGGSVRDLIRGEENLDIDIVIEGDGIAFARELGAALGAKVSVHERFATAKLILDSTKIDIATARTEYYDSPAALPNVITSSIKKDLYRRDFTVNTLAIRLNPGTYGELVDFFGAQQDLKDRRIRVLHNLSFVEDPTRAFRAVRFSERFGFKLSKQTETLISGVIRLNLLDKLSGARLYDEFALICAEEAPSPVIKRLDAYGLLGAMASPLALTKETRNLLDSLHNSLLWFGLSFIEETPERVALYLMALIHPLSTERREEVLQRLQTPPRVHRAVIKGLRDSARTLRKLPLLDPVAIYGALKPLGIESLLLAMSATHNEEARREISSYLLELRKVRPEMSGEDLKEMGLTPGPVYSEILDRVLAEKLRGRLKTRDDETDFVRKNLIKAPKTG